MRGSSSSLKPASIDSTVVLAAVVFRGLSLSQFFLRNSREAQHTRKGNRNTRNSLFAPVRGQIYFVHDAFVENKQVNIGTMYCVDKRAMRCMRMQLELTRTRRARDDTTYKNEAERSSLADAMIITTLQSRRVETHHSLAMQIGCLIYINATR